MVSAFCSASDEIRSVYDQFILNNGFEIPLMMSMSKIGYLLAEHM
jgi:hypothetical protein